MFLKKSLINWINKTKIIYLNWRGFYQVKVVRNIMGLHFEKLKECALLKIIDQGSVLGIDLSTVLMCSIIFKEHTACLS